MLHLFLRFFFHSDAIFSKSEFFFNSKTDAFLLGDVKESYKVGENKHFGVNYMYFAAEK